MNDHLHALPAGHRLGKYLIERVLGSGGFGITYSAQDIDIGKQVAIKEYFPCECAVRTDGATVKPKSTDDQKEYQRGLERCLEEARALAHFKHPHINEVYGFFEDNGTAYIVLEYIEGETLGQLLKREGRLDEDPLRRLLEELLSGLEEVHQAGFIHRDIKPANIMLRENGDAVLLDFGAARQAAGRRSKNITALLTPGYAPIEQYSSQGDDIGPWTDLYSLGMVAYRCVSGIGDGNLPEAGERTLLAHKDEQSKDLAPAVEVARGRYDASLLKAVDWAIQVHKEQRPQNVAAMREALIGGDESDETASDAAQSSEVLDAVAPSPPKSAEDTAGSEKEAEAQRKRFAKVFGRDPSPHTKDADGLTDLHYVAAANMSALARLLLNAGADIHARMKGDAEPMTDTSKKKLQQLTKADFWFYRCSPTPLHLAAWCNALDTAKFLLSRGVDIQAKDKYGKTPLHWAAQNTNALDTAALLITFEAYVQAKDKNGCTPLHLAAEENALDTAKLLISREADVHAKDKDGNTPLHKAVQGDARETAQLLISHGADVHAKDKDGNTPLHKAVQGDARETAQLLISHGADVHAKDKDGWTPLHWAARPNAHEIAQLLISHGADVRAKDKRLRTPRDIAIEYDYSEMAQTLKPKDLKAGMAIAWRVAVIAVLAGEVMVLAAHLTIPEDSLVPVIVGGVVLAPIIGIVCLLPIAAAIAIGTVVLLAALSIPNSEDPALLVFVGGMAITAAIALVVGLIFRAVFVAIAMGVMVGIFVRVIRLGIEQETLSEMDGLIITIVTLVALGAGISVVHGLQKKFLGD